MESKSDADDFKILCKKYQSGEITRNQFIEDRMRQLMRVLNETDDFKSLYEKFEKEEITFKQFVERRNELLKNEESREEEI